jgi:predicted TIM-barrel fold metal-dependent hydrolase
MIDVNVYLGHWPYRRLPLDEARALAEKLGARGIKQALAGHFDALLHRDITSVNVRLAQVCKDSGPFFRPIGAVDPTLPDWEGDLDRCAGELGMPGIRLHPNYHGYKLDDPVFEAVLAKATQRKLFVQLPLTMEDDRTRHPRLSPPSVDAAPLAKLVGKVEGLRLILLNAGKAMSADQAADIVRAGDVLVDLAMVEGLEAVAKWVEAIGPDRLVLGSYAPFFYPESATLKLVESGLPESLLEKVRSANAAKMLTSPL